MRTLPTQLHECHQGFLQPCRRRGIVGAAGAKVGGETIPAFNGNRGQQSLLVSEVPVGRVPRHAGAGPDFAQGDLLWAAGVEELGGSIEQGAAGSWPPIPGG